MKHDRESPLRIAIAVVEHADRFLVGQRPASVPLAGLYEFPGGKMQSDETPAEAARRECLEETGLDVEVIEPYLDCVHAYEHGALHLHFFRCRPVNGEQMPLLPFRWIPRNELAQYEFPAGNVKLLSLLTADA